MTEENPYELISKQATFYCETETPVHIVCHNGFFYNGTIKYVGADFVLLNDRIKGEMPLFFMEMNFIDKFEDKSNG
jgi:hypothetical protein